MEKNNQFDENIIPPEESIGEQLQSLEPVSVETSPASLSVRPARYHFILLLFGVVGLIFISFLVVTIMKNFVTDETAFANFSNLLIYALLLGGFVLILWALRLLKAITTEFTKLKPYLYGLFYGFIVILASVSYGLLTTLVFPSSTSNENQEAIESVIKSYPVTSFLWIVIAGPLVEELIYRLGLFEGLRQKNRIVAYVVSGIIFGFIHFSVPTDASGVVDMDKLANEFINVPGYILSGLLFAYTYEKIGFAGSSVAHVTNNLISFILTIIRIYAEI